jgi:tRNA pseudouridine55 synthase
MKQSQVQLSGIFLIDKPTDITSHDVVDVLRKRLDCPKIGHTGTLDPMATGLMILLIGSATKCQSKLQNCSKVYNGNILLGVETDSWDSDGKVVKERPVSDINFTKIKNIISFFSGKVIQQVPPFSAVRYKGTHLYKLARKRLTVPVIKREVNINWKSYVYKAPEIHFEIECSGGTYVRSVAFEIGKMLGCGGCLKKLRRLKISNWNVKDAVPMEKVKSASIEHLKSKILEIPPSIKSM